MGRAKSKKTKSSKAEIVGDPVIDSENKRLVYSIDVGDMHGHAWEYKYTGDAALAVVNFNDEIRSQKRSLIWSAVNAWRAANREKYAGLLSRL
jgi:hypothetical protein